MVDILVKIAVGLALENAIYNGQEIQRLTSLYSDPDVEGAIKLHDELISSNEHLERETAFFLQLGLDIGPLQGDPLVLAGELREMEHLLYAYLNKYGGAHRAMNDAPPGTPRGYVFMTNTSLYLAGESGAPPSRPNKDGPRPSPSNDPITLEWGPTSQASNPPPYFARPPSRRPSVRHQT